jgi:hypothetical protein
MTIRKTLHNGQNGWDLYCADVCGKLGKKAKPKKLRVSAWTLHIVTLHRMRERGAVPWSLDDLSPLEWWSLSVVAEELRLLNPAATGCPLAGR